jgi:lipoprotein-releasing system permease protein
MFIALLGFMNGLNSLLDGMILNRTPHIRFYNEIKPNPNQPIQLSPKFAADLHSIRSVKPSTSRLAIHNSRAIIAQLEQDPRVLGVSPKLAAQVFFNVGTLDLSSNINGIDGFKEAQLFGFQDYVIEGRVEDLDQLNTIILGKIHTPPIS